MAAAVLFIIPSCSTPGTLGKGFDLDGGPPASAFTNPDASTAPEGGLTEYCAATTCQAPFATCRTSRFPCDVNLMADPINCGECDHVCPFSSGNTRYTCVSGHCQMNCIREPSSWNADCNGFIDDDCEVKLGTNDNCNDCGDRCPDPAKPCIFDSNAGNGQCGCDAGRIFCAPSCINPESSDQNCGACGTACDPTNGGAQLPTNAYYGCAKGQCGELKCAPGFADCDGNRANGCETSLTTDDNCGACKSACDEGQSCRRNKLGQPVCMCPPGELLCEEFSTSSCVRPDSDSHNCGGCGVDCTMVGADKHGVGVCSFGSCGYTCMQGWGDCNDDLKDGCEVNLGSDQLNCGACGHACDVLAGQPCLAGQCAVEPCSEPGKVTQ